MEIRESLTGVAMPKDKRKTIVVLEPYPKKSTQQQPSKEQEEQQPPVEQNAVTQDKDKRTKENPPFICPVCDAIITEDGDDVTGDDAVYCEGICDTWMHRKCVGMSKIVFDNLGGSNDPYLCPTCVISKQSKEISKLRVLVKSLTSELSSLKNLAPKITDLENKLLSTQESDGNNRHPGNSSAPSVMTHHEQPSSIIKQKPKPVSISPNGQVTDKPTIPPRPSQVTPDKKFNLIFYGITESPINTPRTNRQQHDIQNILSVLSTVDSSLTSSSIKDFHRLGKFSASKPSPRPILVKFLRTFEVAYVLSKRSLLEPPITIKPDLSRDERASKAAFLKERYNLAQGGVDRKSVKLRNGHIYVDNTLYGKLEKSNNGYYTVIRVSTLLVSSQGTTGDNISNPTQHTPGDNNSNPTQSSSNNVDDAVSMELQNDSPSR